LNRFTWIS